MFLSVYDRFVYTLVNMEFIVITAVERIYMASLEIAKAGWLWRQST